MIQGKEKRIDRKIIYLLSFSLPLTVMIACMICFEVQPFGDRSFVIIDGLHQYMPFFSILYDKLKAGEGLLYSFRPGLGINFLSLYSYYLSSPLNLLILLFKRDQLNMAVSILIVIKIALSGLNAGIYFTHRKKEPDLTVVAAAFLYALNSYMVGYSWNVMWLDAILIFPIIMLGMDKLIEDRDGRLYCLALFYALFCNYYIAFMICIFAVLWYLLYHFRSFGQFFFRGYAFAFWSILAAAMAAVLLIPAWMGIRQTASGNAMMLPGHEWLTGFADLLTRQLDLATPISHDNFDGNINLYFGIAVLFTAFLYFMNQEIGLVEKLKKGLLLAFLYVSFSERLLNFIWHGFHDQYGIPNRFSFLFGFVLIDMFVEVMGHREAIRNWQTVIATALGVAMLYFSYRQAGEPLEESIYGAAGMLFVFYGMVMLLMTMDRRHSQWHVRLFSLGMVIELTVSAFFGYDSIGQINVPKFFSETGDLEQAVDLHEDGGFYRSELAEAKFVDESSWYRLHGVTLFGSTAMEQTVDIMDSLGFYTGCNEYLYKGADPVTNLMLSVRYQYFHAGDNLSTEFDYTDSIGNISVYENPVEGLSPGYMIDQDIEDWYYNSAYPFRVQNDFCIRGYSVEDVFTDIPIPDPQMNLCSADRTNDGEYHFYYEGSAADNLVFTIPVQTTVDHLYLFYDGTQVANVQVSVDDRTVIAGDKDGIMLYVGQVGGGSKVKVSMELKGESSDGYIRLSAASLDKEKFDLLADRMTGQALQVTDWFDGHIEGEVFAGTGQILYLSIPYDKGWKILMDGEPVEATSIGNAFLAVPMEEGQHHLSMTYTPPGFSMGWKISLGGFILFLLLCVGMPQIRKKKRKFFHEDVEELKELEETLQQAETEGTSYTKYL